MKTTGVFSLMVLTCLVMGQLCAAQERGVVDADAARETATGFARAVDLPWGQDVEVSFQPAEGCQGPTWLLKYHNFTEIVVSAEDGLIVSGLDRCRSVQYEGHASPVTVTEEQAVTRGTLVAQAMGLFSQTTALHDIALMEVARRDDGQVLREWHIRWVRTADGIPYRSDMAIVKLDPSNGRLIGAGKDFWSAPPESTEVRLDEAQALALARERARALDMKPDDVPPSVELQVVQPNNYWGGSGPQENQYPAPSRVAWAVTLRRQNPMGVSHKIFWIDAADGTLLGGTRSIGAATPAPAQGEATEPVSQERAGVPLVAAAAGGGGALLVLGGAALLLARRARAR